MIICKNNDYVIKDYKGKKLIYNQLFAEEKKYVFLAALLDFIYPDAVDYFIPIGCVLSDEQNDVYVDKKFKVTGTEQYEYVVIKEQLELWKKTYGLMKNVMWLLALIINIILCLLLIKTSWNIYLAVAELVVLLMSIGAVFKVEKENNKRKKYKVIQL